MDKIEHNYNFKINNLDATIISHFLSDNYVEDSKFRYNYSAEFIKWYIIDSINIGLYDNDLLIGFICGKKINLFINKNESTFAEIDFLCIKKNHRNNKLCSILLNKIKEEFNKIGIYNAIFTSEHTYPNQITHANYYIRLINPKYLYEIEYINSIPIDIELPKIKGSKYLIKLEKYDDYLKSFELYKKYITKFDCYELFTEKTFIERFMNNHINTFALVDNNYDNNIIDFISYYYIDINVLKQKKITKDGYLYIYSNNSNNLHKMISLLLHKLKENKIDTFIALDIMENNDVLENLNFIHKQSNYNYYLYNINSNINNYKMAKILF
jgi:hypothetical protein